MTDIKKPAKQQTMDQSLEETFPASDPPAVTSPKPDPFPQGQLAQRDHENKGRAADAKKYSKDDFIDKTDV